MSQPLQTSDSHLRISLWRYCQRSGGGAGCMLAIAVIIFGRSWLKITVSTLSGWTALFFLAVFLGLMTANLRSDQPFASTRQVVEILSGVIASAFSLVLLQESLTLAGEIFLGIAGLLLISCLISFRHRATELPVFREKSLAGWAQRLDNLLKYDLAQSNRIKVVLLIDELWCTPPAKGNFIPAQDAEIERLLTALEVGIHIHDEVKIETILRDLIRCLNERNQRIRKPLDIEYCHIENSSRLIESNASINNQRNDNQKY